MFWYLLQGVLSYCSASVAVLFPTYSNTGLYRYMIKLLILIFDSTIRSTYINVLHVVLNSGIANIAVIIKSDSQIVISVPVS